MDKNYVHQLVVDNEIGLALTYLSTFGYDVTVLLSNFNMYHTDYMQGILDYEDYSRFIAIIKSSIVNITSETPPAYLKNATVLKATVIIVASKNDIVLAMSVKAFIEAAGYLVTITDALETQIGSNISTYRLVYVITNNYFEMRTKWPISLTNILTNTTALLFDDSLDRSNYIKLVSALNKDVHDLTDAIDDGIKSGFPVGALANSLVETEQAKLILDKDFSFLWNNPPIDCRKTLFVNSMPAVLEKIKK